MTANPSPTPAKGSAAPVPADVSSPARGEAGPESSTVFTALPAHPLAELFPMMERADIERMGDDICTNGQREDIILLDGRVLDGRNRQEACIFAQIEPRYRDFDPATEGDPLAFVLSLNLERRHLTDGQRAMVAARIVDWENGLNQTTGRAHVPAREAGKKLSISERAVKAARRIRDNGSEELIHAMDEGRISIKTGESLSWLDQAEQARVLADEEKAVIARAREIRDRRRALSRSVRLGLISEIAERGRRTTGEMPRGAYPVGYADPPWEQEAWSDETGQDKGLPYPPMPLDDIMALCAGEASPFTRDAVLYLWVTANRLDDGIAVLKAWGFDYVTCLVWDKVHIGMGRWVRDRHEILLVGKRGTMPAPMPGTQPASLHSEAKGAHSAKPAWFAEAIERLYPGVPKLELFARTPRDGWGVWGFEATGAAGQNDEIVLSREGLRATPPEGATGDDDDLYARAVELVRETGDVSATGLARRLGADRGEASALLARMTAEKVLPLPPRPDGRKRRAA